MVFSTNQNRQLYVAKSYATSVTDASAVGATAVKKDNAGNIYILQKGNGGLVHSDLIDPESVVYSKASAPADMAIKMKRAIVALDSSVNSGAPKSGQDYILRVNFRQYYGMSDEDIYQKYGAVHATAGMTAAQFYQEMAYSLFKNFNRLYSPALYIKFNTGTGTTVTATNAIASVSKSGSTYTFKDASGTTITATSATGIIIDEIPQTAEWSLGCKQYVPVFFEVIPTTIYDGSSDVVWGTVTTTTSGETVGNGYNIADLEYFCMGERGDQYRKKGWPMTIDTKYMVDPTKTYYVLDIHYNYAGDGVQIHKSEKDLTIVSEDSSVIYSIATEMFGTDKVFATTAFEEASESSADNDNLVG